MEAFSRKVFQKKNFKRSFITNKAPMILYGFIRLKKISVQPNLCSLSMNEHSDGLFRVQALVTVKISKKT